MMRKSLSASNGERCAYFWAVACVMACLGRGNELASVQSGVCVCCGLTAVHLGVQTLNHEKYGSGARRKGDRSGSRALLS